MTVNVNHYTILGCFLLFLEEGENHDISGRAAYIKVCERLGIVPASYFLKNITNPSICMKHHGLGVQGTRAVAKVLKVNQFIIVIVIGIGIIIIIIGIMIIVCLQYLWYIIVKNAIITYETLQTQGDSFRISVPLWPM